MNHRGPQRSIFGAAYWHANSVLTVCEDAAESPRTAYYKEQNVSRSFVRRQMTLLRHLSVWYHIQRIALDRSRGWHSPLLSGWPSKSDTAHWSETSGTADILNSSDQGVLLHPTP